MYWKKKKRARTRKKDIEIKKTSINKELSHAVHIMKKKYPEKLKIFEEVKNTEFKEEEKEEEDAYEKMKEYIDIIIKIPK